MGLLSIYRQGLSDMEVTKAGALPVWRQLGSKVVISALLTSSMIIGGPPPMAFAAPVAGASAQIKAPHQDLNVSLRNIRIVAPDAPALRVACEELAQALRGQGATVKIVSPAEVMEASMLSWRPAAQGGEPVTTVVIGNLMNNRATLPLYAAYQVFSDAAYPGGDGYAIRTVLDARQRGGDVVALGGSTEAGIQAAIARTREILGGLNDKLSFPATTEVKLGGDYLTKSAWLKQAAPTSSNPIQTSFYYGMSGDKKFAQAARIGFLKPSGSDKKNGPYYTQQDYWLESLLRAWAMVADSGVFTAQEIQTVQQYFMNTLVHDQNVWWLQRNAARLGSRHQNFGTSSFNSVVKYLLRRSNPDARALALLQKWDEEARTYYAAAFSTFHDDFEDVTSYYSVQAVANHALETGTSGYFKKSGDLSPFELAILRAYASTDNRGYYCGAGTYEEARPGAMKNSLQLRYALAMAAAVNHDQRVAWLLSHFKVPEVSAWGLSLPSDAHQFDMGNAIPEQEPRDWLGAVRVPLGEYRYSRITQGLAKAGIAEAAQVPIKQTFEKLCFRDSFAPNGQYMVVQGYQNDQSNNLPPNDPNSIIRYTDGGVPWLIANTDRTGNFYRNALYVSGGDDKAVDQRIVELVGQSNSGDAHIAVTRLNQYKGGSWTRNVFWLRGKAFVVLDTMRFNTPGERQVTCTYRSAPAAELNGREWVAHSGTAEFHLLNVDDMPISSQRNGTEGAAVPTVLRQMQAVKATGNTVTGANFRNMFYVSTPERPQQFEARPLGESALLVRGGDQALTLLAVRPVGSEAGKMWKVGPFESDADAVYIGTQGVSSVGGTVRWEGKTLAQATPNAVPAATLDALWQAAAPVAKTTGAASALAAPPQPVWAFNGLQPRHPIVLDPVLTSSDNPTRGSLGDLVDGLVPEWIGDVFLTGKNGKDVTLTFDLRREENIAQIDMSGHQLNQDNTLPKSDLTPDKPATVEFSNDNFVKDVRGGPATFRGGYTLDPLNKGYITPMAYWSLDGLQQKARYVRISLNTKPYLRLREIRIRRAGGNEAQFGPSLVSDLDGDGKNEVVVTTDTGELSVIGADGVKRWGHPFMGAVTCLKSAAFAPLLVGTREGRLYCFEADGTQRWMLDFVAAKLPEASPEPFSITTTQKGIDGKPMIVVGNYARVCFISPEGKLHSNAWAYGSFESMALTGMDITGDGVEDGIVFNTWATISVADGAKRTVIPGYLTAPRGDGLLLQRWGATGDLAKDLADKDPRVLVVTDNGLGMLRPVSRKYDWQNPLTPIAAVAIADVDSDGQDEIILGTRDGWLIVMSDKGEVEQKIMLNAEVRSLVVPENMSHRIWVATSNGCQVLDEKLQPVQTFATQAHRLQVLNKDVILALNNRDLSVSALRTR